MSARTVTPAEARTLLNGTTPWPWRVYGNAASEDALSDTWTISHDGDDLAELHADNRPEHGSESDESVAALCEADADLMAAAPALAATVAAEPARIAAAVAEESASIYRAATAALADYLTADDALLDAIGRGLARDEYHPLILARLRRLEYLRGLLAPEVTP